MRYEKQTEVLAHATCVNGWFPHELHESKLPFVYRIEFIRSKLSNFSAHVSGICGAEKGNGNGSSKVGGKWEAGDGRSETTREVRPERADFYSLCHV